MEGFRQPQSLRTYRVFKTEVLGWKSHLETFLSSDKSDLFVAFFCVLRNSYLIDFKEVSLEKGFNSDVAYLGGNYHVQTEDWGLENPYLVSRVYHDGAVLKSIKTAYSEIFPAEAQKNSDNIRLAMKFQHKKILDLLLSGQLLWL